MHGVQWWQYQGISITTQKQNYCLNVYALMRFHRRQFAVFSYVLYHTPTYPHHPSSIHARACFVRGLLMEKVRILFRSTTSDNSNFLVFQQRMCEPLKLELARFYCTAYNLFFSSPCNFLVTRGYSTVYKIVLF